MIEALLWTSVMWALIFGNAAAQIAWYALSRGEYRDTSR